MSAYEPAERILEETESQVKAILAEANERVLRIRTDNKRIVSEMLSAEKEKLIHKLETEALSEYSKFKIKKDKEIQEELEKKRYELKTALLDSIAAEPDYSRLISRLIAEKTKGVKEYKIYANLDFGLIDKAQTPIRDKSIGHGILIDFGPKIYRFDLAAFVEDFLQRHPLEV